MIQAHLAAEVRAADGLAPVYVYTIEHPAGFVLVDARSQPDDDIILEWVGFDGATYVEHDGAGEVLPGVRVMPAPGHTAGHQAVLVETGDGLVVLGGDVAYSFRELGRGKTEGQRRVLELGAHTWLAHVERPKVPRRS